MLALTDSMAAPRLRWARVLATTLAGLVALICTVTVNAQTASSLYLKGAFVQGYHAAAGSDTAASQTLAAKAALAFALFEAPSDQVRLEWFQRAEGAAKRAVALDPNAVEALLALAEAEGDAALLRGPLQNLGVARETHDLLRRVLALQPENPNALVGLGVWNLELTARGVGWMFGASRKGALSMVERGVERAPDDIELRIEYGRALQLVGDQSGARAQFRLALQLPALSAADRFRQQGLSEYLAGKRAAP